jgi:membrane peptidoglycan carboxypeptidase
VTHGCLASGRHHRLGTARLSQVDNEQPVEEVTEPRPRRQFRWKRLVCRALLLTLFYCATGAAAAEAYVDSVPLPDDPAAPQASVLYYRDGHTILARVGVADHSDVPLAQVPLGVQHAVLAAEDRDFYDHLGISARGVLRAVVADAGGASEGASTITQQYVRNAFLTQERSVERKAKELALAIKLERQQSKDAILERYLNTIYYGRGAYGIAAAAHAYFGVSPQQLTLAQGGVLAAVIKDPWHFDPAVNAKDALTRWKWVVKAATEKGWVDTAPQYPTPLPRSAESEALAGPNGLVVDQVERELVAHGVTAQALHTRGLSIVTTLDVVAQGAALRLTAASLRAQAKGMRAALVAVDPSTGAVRAYYGGDKGRGYYDDAAAARPAASTFKPIALAAAMRQGIGYLSRWDGSSPRAFPDRGGVPLVNHGGEQCPNCTLEQSMVKSLNTPFYALAEQVGASRIRDMAISLGIPARYHGRPSLVDVKGDPKPGRTRADIAIGRYPVTPADLASVYGTFAGGGTRHARYFVASATAEDGTALWTAQAAGTAVLDRGIAADISTVLGAVVTGHNASPGRPAAGKTGTQQWGNTHDNQDAWMAGYTPQLAVAVWMGMSVPGPIRTATGAIIEGETAPAHLWTDFLRAALDGQERLTFPAAAHVGRADVGDAGRSHAIGASPDTKTGSKPASGGFAPVVHTAHTGKRLALTFDDGPSEYTPAVLDLLAKYHVKATFCVVGENVDQYRSQVRRIVAEGHALCNHSTHHDDLGGAKPAVIHDDIATTDAAIAAASPGATVTYFRAPYGDWGASAKVGAEAGHTPLGWVVDPDDWMLPGVDTIVSRISQQVKPRAVILVHDGGGNRQQTVDALAVLIPRLLQQGWTFDLPEVTVQARPLPTAPAVPAPPSSSSTPSAAPSMSASPSAPAVPSDPAVVGVSPTPDASAE